MGADGVELDVRLTADRQFAVHHDPALADGRLIADTTARDLPAHVLLLDAAVTACGDLTVNVEIKNVVDEPGHADATEFVSQVYDVLTQHGDDRRWIISSFDRATVQAARALFPSLNVAMLTETLTGDDIDHARRGGFAAINPDQRHVTRDGVEAAHRAGLEVWPWTVNDEERLVEMFEWGVDGLFTDYPDRALGLRDGRARRETRD